MASTRAQLRRAVGNLVGQMKVCTATGVGLTTTFVDLENLAVEGGHYKDRIALFTAGTAANVGLTRRVADNTKATGTLAFARALPAATAVGDEIELWNERGTGVTPDEVHAAIGRAIEGAADSAVAPVASTPAAFSWTAPTVAIPAGWSHVAGAEWQDWESLWRAVPPADLAVDQANRTVELRHRGRDLAQARNVRLHGYTPAAVLTTDASSTHVDRKFVIYQAAFELLLASAHRNADPVAAERKANLFLAEARAREPYVRVRPSNRFGKLVRLQDA